MKPARAVVLIVLALQSWGAASLRPSEVVAKLHGRHAFFVKGYGSAWCLDPLCYVMVTNQHVVMTIGKDLQVNGVPVKETILASGPEDPEAQELAGISGTYKLAIIRDLALLRMKQPLARKHMHGVGLQAGELYPGEPAAVLSFSGGTLAVDRGTLLSISPTGILKLGMESILQPGASGGLVVNGQEKAIGVVFAASPDLRSCYAIPLWSLASFVKKADPILYRKVFSSAEPFTEPPSLGLPTPAEAQSLEQVDLSFGVSKVAPVLPDSYVMAEFSLLWPKARGEARGVQVRSVEVPEVSRLRQKAEEMYRSMRNFIALQTLVLADRSVWEHEVRVVEGRQTFWTEKGREVDELPLPRWGVVPGAEWQTLPEMVGTDLRLPVRYLGKRNVAGGKMRIFDYQASDEDAVCSIRVKGGFLRRIWKGPVMCRGEVWTDEEFNILRMTQELSVPQRAGIDRYQIVILNGWLERPPLRKLLVPVRMHLQVRTNAGLVFVASGSFSDYRVFAATSTIHYAPVARTGSDASH